MSGRYTREDLAAKVEWEGCILDAIEYGIKPEDLPEDAPKGVQEAWARLYHQGREDIRTIYHWLNQEGDDGEGGVSEPGGDSPDSPATGESRLPGGSDDYGTLEPTGNATYPWMSLSKPAPYCRDLWESILRVEPDEVIRASMSSRFPATAETGG